MLRRRDEKLPQFELRFETGPLLDPEGWSYAVGRILLGDFQEPFESSLEHWSAADYERHWRTAANRLVGGADVALFLTSFNGPGASYHLSWPAWRVGDRAIFQNWLILTEQLSAPLDPERAHEVVRSRVTTTDEGQPISEWDVRIDDIQEFLARPSTGGIYVPA